MALFGPEFGKQVGYVITNNRHVLGSVNFPGNLSSNKPDITLKETEIIGEMGVIDSELRTATARAYSEVDVIHVTKEDFEKKLAETDIVIRGVVAVLSDRLRQLQKRRVGQN